MALLTVHSIPLLREFQSTLISRASLFAFSCSLLCIFAPLFVAYSTQGFWVKHQIHREQPVVSFKYQALLLIRSPEHDEITWSTFARYNELSNRNLVYPSITSSETDVNDDGQIDGLELNLMLDTWADTSPHYVQLLLFFSYHIKDVSLVTMEAMAVLQYDSSLPLATLDYVGDLQWVQRKILPFRQVDNRYNQSILSEDQFELSDIFRDYNARDYAAEMRNEHYTPVPNPSNGSLRIRARLRYVEALVEYAPGFWFTLKYAWIQYLSVFIIFLYVIGSVRDYVFVQQLIPTWNEKQIQTIYLTQ